MNDSLKLRQMAKSGGLLALFAVVGSALLAGTYALTKDQIAVAAEARLVRELGTVLPPDRYNNALVNDTLAVNDPRLGGHSTVYRARHDNAPAAVVLSVVAPDGYSGAIHLLVGVDVEGRLTGVRVTEHLETPGLGDKIEVRKADWILEFTGKRIGEPPRERWAVHKDGGDFDQFTGATITPRAVIAAVVRTLDYVAEQQDHLFDAPPDETTP